MQDAIQKLLIERYYLPKESTWDQLAERVSAIHSPIYEYIRKKQFIPSSPTLMNANTDGQRKGTLSSCFIMDIQDSISGIYDALKEGALVTKASGGVGYVFSKLRSSNETVKTLGRKSSGPIPFMMNFNTMLDGIQQGGVRRGAGMAQFDIRHPDILKVIRLKTQEGVLERLNVSIRIDDEFYTLLKTNKDCPHMVWPVDGGCASPLFDNDKSVTVGQLWDEIIHNAWCSAEPGIFNFDIATRQCTTTNVDSFVASNPCAEFVNIPYSSCNLGSINLSKFVKGDDLDWKELSDMVRIATRFLDSVIDHNEYPLEKIDKVTKEIRPIGLGYMGFAHMLFLLKIPYNSEEALSLGGKIAWTITMTSMMESAVIAQEKGAYPAYDYDLFVAANERLFKALPKGDLTTIFLASIEQNGVRNSCFTSIAPTGSISYLANCSSGIEPVYALTYSRRIEKLDKQYETVYITDPVFEAYLDEYYSPEEKQDILERVAKDGGSCQRIESMSEDDRKIFITANDLTADEHLNMLGVIARNTSLSVSKTINLPKTATEKDISDVYLKAHDLGVIGVTVYRDGCRQGILSTQEEIINDFRISHAPKRPKELDANLHVIMVNGTRFGVIIGLYDERPYEVFALQLKEKYKDRQGKLVKIKKGRYDFVSDSLTIENINITTKKEKTITILASLALRHGADIPVIIKTVQKISTGLTDFSAAICRILKKYLKEGQELLELCPDCRGKLVLEDGCSRCPFCGLSKCA